MGLRVLAVLEPIVDRKLLLLSARFTLYEAICRQQIGRIGAARTYARLALQTLAPLIVLDEHYELKDLTWLIKEALGHDDPVLAEAYLSNAHQLVKQL